MCLSSRNGARADLKTATVKHKLLFCPELHLHTMVKQNKAQLTHKFGFKSILMLHLHVLSPSVRKKTFVQALGSEFSMKVTQRFSDGRTSQKGEENQTCHTGIIKGTAWIVKQGAEFSAFQKTAIEQLS